LETVYDWVSIAIFAGLVVLFMQRSTQRVQRDSLWQYLVAAVGCAVANWLGNTGLGEGKILLQAAAIIVIVGTLGFIWVVLRPLDRPIE
jgi:uncharacterized membrane protein YjjP (DUF1212 family)